MATTRKRTSGFSTDTESEEQVLVEATETLEVTEEIHEIIMEEPVAEVKSEPFVEQTIVPMEDPGPRFLETPPAPAPAPKKAPTLQPAPKRHPRNVPKFSRSR
jgi:hypothetical protein